MIGKSLMKHYYLKKKKEFCSNLNMEDITDSDYKYGKRFCEDFKMKNLVEYDTAFS